MALESQPHTHCPVFLTTEQHRARPRKATPGCTLRLRHSSAVPFWAILSLTLPACLNSWLWSHSALTSLGYW